jgi:hypothetical protein
MVTVPVSYGKKTWGLRSYDEMYTDAAVSCALDTVCAVVTVVVLAEPAALAAPASSKSKMILNKPDIFFIISPVG